MKKWEIERLREKYAVGTRVVLDYMEGESRMHPGLEGTVTGVDDIGQIHVKWENGSGLALNTEVDTFHCLEPAEETSMQGEEMQGGSEMDMYYH